LLLSQEEKEGKRKGISGVSPRKREKKLKKYPLKAPLRTKRGDKCPVPGNGKSTCKDEKRVKSQRKRRKEKKQETGTRL